MSEQKPVLKHFPRIREARELLLAQAEELIQLKIKIAKDAMSVGDFETADNCINWLLEHMPANEGMKVIEASIDKAPAPSAASKGPQIQIGVILGGVNAPKSLPSSTVIDVKEIPNDTDSNWDSR